MKTVFHNAIEVYWDALQTLKKKGEDTNWLSMNSCNYTSYILPIASFTKIAWHDHATSDHESTMASIPYRLIDFTISLENYKYIAI